MAWFKHRHWWRIKIPETPIKPDANGVGGIIIVEDCRCGAVRTIEIWANQAAIVRITQPEE